MPRSQRWLFAAAAPLGRNPWRWPPLRSLCHSRGRAGVGLWGSPGPGDPFSAPVRTGGRRCGWGRSGDGALTYLEMDFAALGTQTGAVFSVALPPLCSALLQNAVLPSASVLRDRSFPGNLPLTCGAVGSRSCPRAARGAFGVRAPAWSSSWGLNLCL